MLYNLLHIWHARSDFRKTVRDFPAGRTKRAGPRGLTIFFSLGVSQTAPVKRFWAIAFLGLIPLAIRAQEVTLPPMVVTGSFELRQGPSITDLFTQHLERQIAGKRALEEAAERAPWFNAKIWRYLPQMQSSQIDSSQFFTPSYLTTDYRNAERALRESQKQSLFGR